MPRFENAICTQPAPGSLADTLLMGSFVATEIGATVNERGMHIKNEARKGGLTTNGTKSHDKDNVTAPQSQSRAESFRVEFQ